MTDPIAPISKQPCRREDALAVVKRLRDAGHVAYFAGGCVRDELLGITPKDYDVATDAPPQRVRELFRNTQAVGVAFGVILVRHGKSVVEVATFRSDGAYLDGRRPSEVHFTTAEQDAKRRDFTINGLFFDPIENRVIDYVGGQEDLKAKILRAIGDPNHRFEEDHLRLMRAVRFAARFDLAIEPKTSDAIRAHAAQLKAISPERIAEELRLMLTPATRGHAWKLLEESRLTDVIFRFASPCETSPLDQAWQIVQQLGADPAPFGLALAAIAMSRRRDPLSLFAAQEVSQLVRALRQSLRFSNEESDELSETLGGIAMLLNHPAPAIAVMKRFLARSTAPPSRRLMRVLASLDFARDRIEVLEHALDQLAATEYAPASLLTGDDLVAAGWTPGPIFKRVLDHVYDAQLEDRITTKQQALELAAKLKTQGVT